MPNKTKIVIHVKQFSLRQVPYTNGNLDVILIITFGVWYYLKKYLFRSEYFACYCMTSKNFIIHWRLSSKHCYNILKDSLAPGFFGSTTCLIKQYYPFQTIYIFWIIHKALHSATLVRMCVRTMHFNKNLDFR